MARESSSTPSTSKIAPADHEASIAIVFCFNRAVALRISSCAKMALMTAMPQMPLPDSSMTLSAVIPPMAMTGISTAAQIARKVSMDTAAASSFEPVGKMAPTPR